MAQSSPWRSVMRAGPAAWAVWAMVLGVGAASTTVLRSAAAAAVTEPATFHVDCRAAGGGNGSQRSPWNSLTEASAADLRPGQRLLFARGTACSGSLEVTRSGRPGHPIVVGAYGKGPLPRIVGTGTDAVLVENSSNVTVEDLEITNEGTRDVPRRGVHVVADGTLVRGVTLEGLSIHDVDGNLSKDTGGSGGIQLDALGTAPDGRFDHITITDNHIDDVSRSGIFVVGTQDDSRPPSDRAWSAGSTGIVVSHNTLAHLAGDGIVATGTVGAILEDNTVTDGNLAGTPYTQPNAICDAGIWAWNANSSVIQDNVVSDMQFNGCDGEGYDVDYNQDGTIVQDNISEDNGGGFILLCTDKNPHDAEVRYNLSVGDAATIEDAPCDIGAGNVGTLDGIRMYDNTIVGPDPSVDLELAPLTSMFAPGDFAFLDNIVDATTPRSTPMPCGDDCTHNLFFQVPPSGTDPVVGDPLFKDPVLEGTARVPMAGGFAVNPRSPAVRAGNIVNDGARQDFFGHSVPTGKPPTIGFEQVP